MTATRETPALAPRERFVAEAPFDPEYPRALAIYCSDGRFTDAVEELLERSGHERLDTLTLPGGSALLDFWTASWSEREAMTHALSFLVEKHGIERVVLIAHAGCGFYREHFRHEPAYLLRERQERDLRLAARLVREAHPELEVDLYFAEPVNGRVAFERVPVAG
ncbi:hypothetical protein HY251_14665 [bacterium]|nr:hypothetical protein [bacterium]